MICIDDLKALVDSELRDSRKKHTYGVAKTARELAKLYGENPDDAEYAALFHDLYKGKSKDEMNQLIVEWGIDHRYLNNPSLAHSKLAAYAMKNIYGVTDQNLINAVSYHTTGRNNMSKLEKIVYLADGIEPNRDYPEVEENRRIARKSLNLGCLIGIEAVINKLKSMGETEESIDKDTIEAREYLIKELKKEKLNGKDRN